MRPAAAAIAFACFVAACGPGPGTSAKVRFRNQTEPGTGPSVFEMKLVKIALVGSDRQTVIYRNPECDLIAGCEATELFDFAATSVDVDADARTILTGKYSRFDLMLCSSAGQPVVRWQAGEMTAPREFARSCPVSGDLDDRIVVDAGNQLDVRFSYDAASGVQTGATATGADCDETVVPRVCFTVPAFEPDIDVTYVVE